MSINGSENRGGQTEQTIHLVEHDGRTIGSPTALNHLLDSFRTQVGGIDEETALAIQENAFTDEMAGEVLELIADDEFLFTRYDDELNQMMHTTNRLVEVLIYLGGDIDEDDLESVQLQKEGMASDPESYELMLQTFTNYRDLLAEILEERPETDALVVSLNDKMQLRMAQEIGDFEAAIPGLSFTELREEVNEAINETLDEKGAKRITNGQLRLIIRAYEATIFETIAGDIDNDNWELSVNQENLDRCLQLIREA